MKDSGYLLLLLLYWRFRRQRHGEAPNKQNKALEPPHMC